MTLWQVIGGTLTVIIGFAYFTNPFSRYSIVRRSYRVTMREDVLEAINENHKLRVTKNPIEKFLAVANNGLYIYWSRLHKRRASKMQTVDDIISEIYEKRFDPNKLLLTSGDHFSSLFVRNLGVFYYPVLDTHLDTTEERWQARQITYLQTLAFALGVFDKSEKLTTTIVPTGSYRATCVNFHAYPSDTMYGILYALSALRGDQSARPYDYGQQHLANDTAEAAQMLLEEYETSLIRLYRSYREKVYDPEIGLIDKSVTLSGAKDITMRSSAFFDNVVFWKTSALAMDLGLISHDPDWLDELKQRIIENFWLEDEGYFLEDLSDEGIANSYYSSDWLIVLATGFLSIDEPNELQYFVRSSDYIAKKSIARPFAIKYQHETRAHRQFPIVRFAVASYGGDSIWSFWGMEFIKSQMELYRVTGETKYLKEADFQIAAYEKKMLEYGGFPELYDHKGDMLETPFYRSIIQTGWVVGFEQVRAIRACLES